MVGRDERLMKVLLHHLALTLGFVGDLACDHVIESRAKAVDVGGRTDVDFPLDLLGGDVVGRAVRAAGFAFGERAIGHHACEAEVGEFGNARHRHHDVARLDVAVHDASVMRVLERGGDLTNDVERLAFGDALAGNDAVVHSVAVDILHHEVVQAVGFADLVGGNDVVVTEARGRPAFLLEARDEVRVLAEVLGQNLDSDEPVERDLAREVDLGHRALSEFSQDLIALNPGDRLSRLGLDADLVELVGRGQVSLEEEFAQRGGAALFNAGAQFAQALIHRRLADDATLDECATERGVEIGSAARARAHARARSRARTFVDRATRTRQISRRGVGVSVGSLLVWLICQAD